MASSAEKEPKQVRRRTRKVLRYFLLFSAPPMHKHKWISRESRARANKCAQRNPMSHMHCSLSWMFWVPQDMF